MSLHLFLGAAGSGKSSALVEEIISHAMAHPEMSHLLLVPEQFCLSTQRLLVEKHPRHALLNIEALSFDRLAARCFREQSARKSEILTDTARRMLLSLAVRDCRKELQVYEKQALRPGFVQRLSSLFAEWDMNDLSADRLEEIAGEESLSPLLRLKLTDLTRIFRAFKARLGGDLTAEEVLPLFARMLPHSRVGRVDRLYLDGFTGFTSVQYRILTQLMKRCPETVVTLTLPEEEKDLPRVPGDLFMLSKLSRERLEHCAEEAGRLTVIHTIDSAPEKKPDLAFLEKHFLRDRGRAEFREKPEHLHLFACDTAAGEAAFAVRLIRCLVREEGLHYRDLALVVGDLNLYVPLLRRELEEAGIPYFTDRRESLAHHPFVRLIQAALEAVQDGFPRDAVLRFLKNPCGPLSREETDRLENYLLAAGIRRGRGLTETFTRNRLMRPGEDSIRYEERAAEETAECETLRERAMTPLIRLKEALQPPLTAASGAAAVQSLLQELGAGEKADIWGEEAVLEQIDALLDNMIGIMGQAPLKLRELTEMLSAGLEALTVGALPTAPDQVLIGDLQRSRFGRLETLIFLGLNEGLVPHARSSGKLITDSERLALSRFEADLGYTDEKALLEERFYLYSLLAKPRQSLYISYALSGGTDSESREKLPSFAVKEITRLFPALKTERYEEEAWPLVGTEDAASRLAKAFVRQKESGTLYRLLAEQPGAEKPLSMIRAGALLRFENISLGPELAAELYGNELSGSVTKLEQFAACPFSFFLQYGLKLAPRPELRWEAADHGNFFHKVMETMLRKVKTEKIDLAEADAVQKQALVEEAVETALKDAGSAWEEKTDREYLLARWKRYFSVYLDYLAGVGLQDGFFPDAFELKFGPKEKELTRIPLDRGTLQLSGKIDRLDISRREEGLYLRVVDYKTGAESFDPAKVVSGQQLQLAAYLDMALRLYAKKEDGPVYPGGMVYALLTEPALKWAGDEEKLRTELNEALRPNGLTAQEVAGIQTAKNGRTRTGKGAESRRRLELLAEFAREKMKELGNGILSGEITPSPAQDTKGDVCKFCRYKEICSFDRKLENCVPRDIAIKKEEAWSIITGGKEAEDGGNEIQS